MTDPANILAAGLLGVAAARLAGGQGSVGPQGPRGPVGPRGPAGDDQWAYQYGIRAPGVDTGVQYMPSSWGGAGISTDENFAPLPLGTFVISELFAQVIQLDMPPVPADQQWQFTVATQDNNGGFVDVIATINPTIGARYWTASVATPITNTPAAQRVLAFGYRFLGGTGGASDWLWKVSLKLRRA